MGFAKVSQIKALCGIAGPLLFANLALGFSTGKKSLRRSAVQNFGTNGARLAAEKAFVEAVCRMLGTGASSVAEPHLTANFCKNASMVGK